MLDKPWLLILISNKLFSQEAIVADLKVQGNKKLKTAFVKKLSTINAGVALDSLVIE